MSAEEISIMTVVDKNERLESYTKSNWLKFKSSFLWSSREIVFMAARNYPAFQVVHEEIERTSTDQINGKVPMIEIVPTIGSICCIFFIASILVESPGFQNFLKRGLEVACRF